MIGQRFGSLEVVRRTDTRNVRGAVWVCRCDCGREIERSTGDLNRTVREGWQRVCCDACRRVAPFTARTGKRTCGRCGHHREATTFRQLKVGGRRRWLCKLCADEQDTRPAKPPPCMLCADLPHRVEGMRCSNCGLPYAPLPPVRLDTTARKPGALALCMVGGG